MRVNKLIAKLKNPLTWFDKLTPTPRLRSTGTTACPSKLARAKTGSGFFKPFALVPIPVEGSKGLNERLCNGFTLMEVMLAMGVLTVSLFVISEIMLRSLSRIQENQDNLEKVFIIKRELYLNFLRPKIEEKRVVTKIEDPVLTLVTTLELIKPKSEFRNYKDSLKFMQTNGIWKVDQKQKESVMMSIVFKPKEKEAKK